MAHAESLHLQGTANLSAFITANLPLILAEWEVFAKTLLPSAATMDSLALRDHARQILEAIARDILEPQSEGERSTKSKGGDTQEDSVDSAAGIHGALRHTAGFDLRQLFAEYRALRASVLRLWAEQAEGAGTAALEQMTRFNEAIDQALAESVARYSEDVDTSRDTFIAILGHDLRSPLQAVTMSSGILGSPGVSETMRAKALARIQRSALTMNHMIRDLLEYTRARLGKAIPIRPQTLDVGAVVREALAEVQAGYPQQSFRIESEGELEAMIDAPRMQQAITNLLMNAIQHGTRGTAIELIARSRGSSVAIEIGNKGKKIAPQSMHTLFDPLIQLEDSPDDRRSMNLGLGLYIARDIAVGHGGSIEAASTEERTSFTILVPRAEPRAPSAARSGAV
ncbi:MAG TPA: HAMP domain-containing sensor histidine kinase [Usitatibacter sp.]|nr:HAMP domain-containing sensor histidine kinase [Usitatibacter sp.]